MPCPGLLAAAVHVIRTEHKACDAIVVQVQGIEQLFPAVLCSRVKNRLEVILY